MHSRGCPVLRRWDSRAKILAMQGKALPGFRDFYPEDLTIRNHIFATWRSVAARYGFEEYDGPPLESLELYTQKSGDEIVGEASFLADAELMAAAVDIMRALGLGAGDVRLRVSDRRLINALLTSRGLTEGQLPTAYAVIDRSERVPRQVLEEMLKDAKIGKKETSAVFEVAALRGKDALAQGGQSAEHLTEAVRALEAMSLGDFVSIDLTIVRGLAYYTGIVWELFDATKSLRAIAGGGRYDSLLDLPALGFGMGDVVLGELLKERGAVSKASSELGAFLIPVGGDDLATVLQLAHALRDRGI